MKVKRRTGLNVLRIEVAAQLCRLDVEWNVTQLLPSLDVIMKGGFAMEKSFEDGMQCQKKVKVMKVKVIESEMKSL